MAGFCLSLARTKFPMSGHCLSDGVATITSDSCFTKALPEFLCQILGSQMGIAPEHLHRLVPGDSRDFLITKAGFDKICDGGFRL